MNHFDAEWREWAEICIAKDASEATHETLRNAFYSGAMTWERLILRIHKSNDRAAAALVVAELYEEMRAYADELLSKIDIVHNGAPH